MTGAYESYGVVKMKLIWKGILVFVLCATSSLGIAQNSTRSKSDFNGEWRWSRGEEGLTLYLKQTGKTLSGHHSAIGQGGMKVDEVADDQPPSITGEVQGGTATVEFKSGFPDSQGGGRAKLTLKGGFLYWSVLESTGEHYLPRSAKLARIHRRASKSTAKTTTKTPPQQESKTAKYDLDVGIEKARLGILGVFPTRFTTLVLSITNRDKRYVTIHKVIVNEEYEMSGKGEWLLPSKRGVSFPVLLGLGDRLSREIYPYKREIIYVDIETDSGVQRIKLAPRRATVDPDN
jgi:hypothetical protein